MRRVVSGLVSLEGFGLAPRFRAAVQAGQVEIEEYSEHTLICRLQAAAHRLPFVPTKAGLGTDMIGLHPQTTRREQDSATGEAYVACTPLPLDVAVVHASEGDSRGNVRVDPKLVWMDAEVSRAAATTIVTVERTVPESSLPSPSPGARPIRASWSTSSPRRRGARTRHRCFPLYGYDGDFFRSYVAAHADPVEAQRFWSERIDGPESHGAFLDANGGAATLLGIARSRS